MKNIVLTRIDERLMHGQVIVSWIPYLKADEVIIVDDEYANDDFMSLLINNAAPNNVKVNILTAEKSAEYIMGNDDGARILVLLKNIKHLKDLIDSGIVLNKINVGNVGSDPERKQYYNTVYLSDNELNILKEISNHAEVEIKMLPNDKAMSLV